MMHLRSLLFIILSGLSVFPWGLWLLCLWFAPHQKRFAVARSFAQHISRMLKLFCGIDVVVKGKENLPQRASVVMIKHSSPWETLAELSIFPRHVIVLKRELMWVPFLGWCLSALESISIDRRAGRSSVNQVIEQGSEHLDKGTWVNIFPEGTRLDTGQLGRFGLSGPLLAIEANAPIVPVAHNAADHWPNRRLKKTPGTIVMKIGPPIDPQGKSPEQLAHEARDWMEATMAEISPAHRNQ